MGRRWCLGPPEGRSVSTGAKEAISLAYSFGDTWLPVARGHRRIIDDEGRKTGSLTVQGRWQSGLAEVKVQEGESIEGALRRFKRKVQQEDIIKDIKKHAFYLKPADKRRAKQALARKRSRKKQRRETE